MTTPTATTAPSAARHAAAPFRFSTSLILQEATGLRAATLAQLAQLLREVPDGCIYHHTHHFLLIHQSFTPEPANDLAYWVTEVLGEELLGERLAGIDIMAYASLSALREVLVRTVEEYLRDSPTARLRFVSAGQEFFFVKSVHVIMPTPYTATTLAEFAQALERVSLHALYFHMFDARLRIGRTTNDFALWVSEQLGLQKLGERMAHLDPYAHTLDALRQTLLSLIAEELPSAQGATHA